MELQGGAHDDGAGVGSADCASAGAASAGGAGATNSIASTITVKRENGFETMGTAVTGRAARDAAGLAFAGAGTSDGLAGASADRTIEAAFDGLTALASSGIGLVSSRAGCAVASSALAVSTSTSRTSTGSWNDAS